MCALVVTAIWGCSKEDDNYYNNSVNEIAIPTGVSASVSGSYVSISWNPVSGASSYNVYRSSSATGTYVLLSWLKNTKGNNALDTNPLNGDNFYKIKAVKTSMYGDHESNYSSYAHVYFSNAGGNTGGGSDDTGGGNTGGSGDVQQKPSAPTGVTVSNEGNNYIPDVVVRWNAVSNATMYYIYKSSLANGSYSKIGETSYALYGYCDSNAPTNGASAYYKVKAVNSAGESAFSDYAKYTSTSNDVAFRPATPTVSVSGTSTISISWTCATGNNYGNPKSYEVYKRNPSTSQFELLTTTTSKSYSDRNTHPGINRYGVIAINDAGKSSMGLGYSNEVPLSKPSSFSAYKSGSNVNFTWSKVANATGYQIFSSSSASGSYYILTQIDDASTTSKSVYYPASSGTTTYFKIRAYWQESYGGSIVYSDYTTYKSVNF